MTQRSRVRDLVVFIPAMMGSRLLHNGSPIWGDESRTFLTWVRQQGDRLGRLAIGPDDPGVDDLGDGITPDGVLETSFVAGRFLRLGGYRSLLRFLQNDLGLRRGENLQLFAYDWRRDLEVAARRLATKAEGWLHAWKARSGNRDARLVLVGHGMGGLVARYYADVLEGWPAVSRLVTLGTPLLGSVRALDFLYFGADFESHGLPLHDVTPIARTFTSVYQLLPHYPSIQALAGEVVSPFEIRIPTFEHQKMDRSRQLHRNLVEHHARRRASSDYASMRITEIVGVGQPTVERARLRPNGTLSVDVDPHEIESDGDGVVPRFSADASGPAGLSAHCLYLPQSHGLLASDPVVHSHLRDLLVEEKPGAPPPKSALPRITLRRTVTDQLRVETDSLGLCVGRPFYKLGQTVELRVLARTATGHPFGARSCPVTVRVDHVVPVGKRVRSAIVRLGAENGRPGWLVGRFKATAPGTFLATASTPQKLLAPFRVGDLFEVDAGRT